MFLSFEYFNFSYFEKKKTSCKYLKGLSHVFHFLKGNAFVRIPVFSESYMVTKILSPVRIESDNRYPKNNSCVS